MSPELNDDADAPTLDEMGIFQGLGGPRQTGRSLVRSIRGKWELLHTQLWDTLVVAPTATTQLDFFASPISSTKSRLLTNLTTAARIPQGGAFDIMSMRFEIVDELAQEALAAEVREILFLGYSQLTISQNRYLERLLTQMPAGGGVFHGGAATTTTTTNFRPAMNGVPSADAAAELFASIRVPRNVDFGVTVLWPTAPTPTVATSVRVILDGILTRRRLPKGV